MLEVHFHLSSQVNVFVKPVNWSEAHKSLLVLNFNVDAVQVLPMWWMAHLGWEEFAESRASLDMKPGTLIPQSAPCNP